MARKWGVFSVIVVALVVSPGVDATCQDEAQNCRTLAAWCSNARWERFLKRYCAQTCGFCGSTTQPPVITTTPPPVTLPPLPTGDSGPPPSGKCGSKPHTRIVGGTEASKGSWPWQALVTNPRGSAFCGGTLVAPQWVVTASHCVNKKATSDIRVRLGAHFRYTQENSEQHFTLEKVITHDNFNKPRGLGNNDIALLKLEKPARMTSRVGLACLPDERNELPINHQTKKCWATGWGTVSSGGAFAQSLRQVALPLVSKARCQKSYGRSRIDDSMLCAGLDQGGVDSCQGDSGGPLVCEFNGRWFLEGVVSWGYGCADPGYYGIYAHVRQLKSWVLNKMNNN